MRLQARAVETLAGKKKFVEPDSAVGNSRRLKPAKPLSRKKPLEKEKPEKKCLNLNETYRGGNSKTWE